MPQLSRVGFLMLMGDLPSGGVDIFAGVTPVPGGGGDDTFIPSLDFSFAANSQFISLMFED